MKTKIILVGLFLTASLCSAQTRTTRKVTESSTTNSDVLTNANVVAMVKAGLPKSVILNAIQTSSTKFDASANSMIALKKQGVSDELLSAMAAKGGSANTSSALNTTLTGTSKAETGLGKLDPGIYYSDESNNKQAPLEASVFSQSKVGSGLLSGLTYGIAKTKAKAVLSGVQANLQVSNLNPVFYFIFPHNTGSNIGNESNANGGWYSNATSPNEFILVKFKVVNTSKQKGREVVTGSFGTYSGFSGGIEDESKVTYRFTKLTPGVYKVYFESPLKEGEYAFLFAGTAATAVGSTTSQKAFDFSITK